MVGILKKNSDRAGYKFAPVIRTDSISGYLLGERRPGQVFEQVPPSLTLRAGFWLVMDRPINGASILLISTAGDDPGLCSRMRNISVYHAPRYGTAYVGEVVEMDDGDFLLPIKRDEFPPLDLRHQLEYVGKVVASR